MVADLGGRRCADDRPWASVHSSGGTAILTSIDHGRAFQASVGLADHHGPGWPRPTPGSPGIRGRRRSVLDLGGVRPDAPAIALDELHVQAPSGRTCTTVPGDGRPGRTVVSAGSRAWCSSSSSRWFRSLRTFRCRAGRRRGGTEQQLIAGDQRTAGCRGVASGRARAVAGQQALRSVLTTRPGRAVDPPLVHHRGLSSVGAGGDACRARSLELLGHAVDVGRPHPGHGRVQGGDDHSSDDAGVEVRAE